jgi:hypothetical protein
MSFLQDNVAKWTVSHEGQRYGPYPGTVLAEWIAIGRISPEAVVSEDGGPWISTEEFMQQQAAAMRTGQPPVLAVAPVEMGDTTLTPAVEETPTISIEQAMGSDELAPERDRIVVLGRTRSGKTIYLAELYAKLWKSMNGMTAKAVSGGVHSYLMNIHQTLQRGEWPKPTQLGAQQLELEIEHAGRKRLMVTLDFSGETFRRTFVQEQADFRGVKELTNHIDRAAAVLLLVDPSIASGMDHEARMDDDFGIVQAVQRIRNWPDGDQVPIVLILTKMDQNQHLLDQHGGSKGFVRHHFPALVRLMKHVPIFQVSAVQTDKGPDGRNIPRADSQPVNIDPPLQFCLEFMDKREEEAEQKRAEEQRISYERQVAEVEQAREKKQNVVLFLSMGIILVAGVLAAIFILIHKL